MAFWLGAAGALAIACFTPVPAQATTWYVDNTATGPNYDGTAADPFLTIEDGIDAASGDNQDTVLVLNGTGTYSGTGNWDLTITNKPVTVKHEGDPNGCIIDCDGDPNNHHRAFTIVTEAGEETCLEGFKIINGYIFGANGGAILNTGDGAFRITNCVFEDNEAVDDPDALPPTIEGFGGAIYNENVPAGAIIKCTFEGNKAEKSGAVGNINKDQPCNHLNIVNCEFIGNRSHTHGGALGGDVDHNATITNCRFVGNLSWRSGGAIGIGHDTVLAMINCTVSGNRANAGGGYGGAVSAYDGCTVSLRNCILWDDENRTGSQGHEIALILDCSLTVSYSDIEGGQQAIYGSSSEIHWQAGNIDEDPLFDSPGYWELQPGGNPDLWFDYDWVDGDYHFSAGTPTPPCVDAGDNDALPADVADLDGDTNVDEQIPLDLDLNDRIQRCDVDMGVYEFDPPCGSDLEPDGDCDLGDLALLLSNYGMTTGAKYSDGDVLDCDDDVELNDLAELLGDYGCGAGDGDGGGGGGGGDGDGPSMVDVSVEAYDTGGYTGGGFNGEADHFVFDLKIEVDDPNSDDWVATGAVLDTSNDATFRLSTTATTPNQYATFVAAPWTTLPVLPNASVVGAYDPPDPDEVFTTTDINLGWYDMVESNDGPATVMRLVIDVSEVKDADVSEGFGSVYFSTTGKIGKDDILVADLDSGTCTAESAPDLKSLSGEFYVKGE